MSSTTLIESPVSGTAPETRPSSSSLPPLLGVVPVAGPAAFVYVGFGVVLLLLLVPPLTLLVTVVGFALVVATALVALVVLVAAIIKAPFLLVGVLRGRRLGHISLPVPQVSNVRVRRV